MARTSFYRGGMVATSCRPCFAVQCAPLPHRQRASLRQTTAGGVETLGEAGTSVTVEDLSSCHKDLLRVAPTWQMILPISSREIDAEPQR